MQKPYVIFGVIMGGPAFICIVITFIVDPSMWKIALMYSLGALFVMVWISSNRIIITEDQVTYKSLFGGRVSLSLSQIKSAKILVGVFKYLDRLKPTVRLEVKTGDKEVNIPLKLYDREELVPLFDLLGVE